MSALFAEWREAAARDPAAATRTFRAEKHRLFRDHPQSPVPAGERQSFAGLAYWPYDPAYRMAVPLDPEPADSGPHAGEAPARDGPWGLGPPGSAPARSASRRLRAARST